MLVTQHKHYSLRLHTDSIKIQKYLLIWRVAYLFIDIGWRTKFTGSCYCHWRKSRFSSSSRVGIDMMEVKEFVALAHCNIHVEKHVNRSYWVWSVLLLVMFLYFTDSTMCTLEQSEIKCSGEEYTRAASGEVTWESNLYGLESLAMGPYQWYF